MRRNRLVFTSPDFAEEITEKTLFSLSPSINESRSIPFLILKVFYEGYNGGLRWSNETWRKMYGYQKITRLRLVFTSYFLFSYGVALSFFTKCLLFFFFSHICNANNLYGYLRPRAFIIFILTFLYFAFLFFPCLDLLIILFIFCINFTSFINFFFLIFFLVTVPV